MKSNEKIFESVMKKYEDKKNEKKQLLNSFFGASVAVILSFFAILPIVLSFNHSRENSAVNTNSSNSFSSSSNDYGFGAATEDVPWSISYGDALLELDKYSEFVGFMPNNIDYYSMSKIVNTSLNKNHWINLLYISSEDDEQWDIFYYFYGIEKAGSAGWLNFSQEITYKGRTGIMYSCEYDFSEFIKCKFDFGNGIGIVMTYSNKDKTFSCKDINNMNAVLSKVFY